jgi:hypothetical protein
VAEITENTKKLLKKSRAAQGRLAKQKKEKYKA